MDTRLKQRLLGAVVLVTLAVVFIPMLLQGPVEQDIPVIDVPIPAPPDPEVSAPLMPSPAPVISAPAPVVVDADTPEPEEPDMSPETVIADTDSAPADEPSQPPAPASAPAQELGAWVVQVGSFAQQANALALRDKLRAKGYATFVERIPTADGAAFRVRVGPEIERTDAEALRKQLAQREKITGMVQSHP